jgi:DNA polymerase elongation subunit (family B)
MRFYTNVKSIGDYIFYRGYDDGVEIKDKIKYQPTLYVPSKIKTEYKTLNGQYISPINPGTISDTRKFIDQYKDVSGFEYYGNENPIYQYISELYPNDTIDYDINQIRLYVLDIETTAEQGVIDAQEAGEEILLITIQDYSKQITYTWGSRPFTEKLDNHIYYECENERVLLQKFLTFWENAYPDVLTGWNIGGFDIPYIINRIEKNFGESETKRLSIWKKITCREYIVKDKVVFDYDIFGITTLDYLELFKKFAYINTENNRLDTVAEEVLNERKLEHDEFETFKDFYTKDFNLFVKYNVQDCNLISRFEKKLSLIQLAFTLAYQAKVNPQDVYYQGRMWDGIIYNYLIKDKIVIPSKKGSEEKTEKFKGAHVKEPQIGKFKYVCSFDLASLYPSLIRTYNISPETLIEERNDYVSISSIIKNEFEIKSEHSDYTICSNGSMYSRKVQGFLPKIMEKMFNERSVYKKKMLQAQSLYEKTPSVKLEEEISTYKNYQQALKICLNSAFGSLGNQYFRFYDIRNAEAITYSGQSVIKWIERDLNSYLNKISGTEDVDLVLAMDTDSCFLNFEPIVNKVFKNKKPTELEIINFLTQICDGVMQEFIDRSFDKLCKITNSYQNCLHMKREKICSSGLWRKKKNYILNVWDNEGVRYAEPKIKMSGIEAVKTSTPSYCRNEIKNAIKIIMNGEQDELIDYVSKIRNQFYNLSPEEIAFPRGISDINKFYSKADIYTKGTPIHVRGSLLYNHYIKKKKLTTKYSSINNGEKIKYIYLKKPNTINENVISFIQKFPKELGLDKYIDYDLQFEKSFLDPLRSLVEIIGWKTEKTTTLESFFM